MPAPRGRTQRRAQEGLYGAWLLDREHWPAVCSCVAAMVASTPDGFPVCCKIRLLPQLADTIKFARLLAGAAVAPTATRPPWHALPQGRIAAARV